MRGVRTGAFLAGHIAADGEPAREADEDDDIDKQYTQSVQVSERR